MATIISTDILKISHTLNSEVPAYIKDSTSHLVNKKSLLGFHTIYKLLAELVILKIIS